MLLFFLLQQIRINRHVTIPFKFHIVQHQRRGGSSCAQLTEKTHESSASTARRVRLCTKSQDKNSPALFMQSRMTTGKVCDHDNIYGFFCSKRFCSAIVLYYSQQRFCFGQLQILNQIRMRYKQPSTIIRCGFTVQFTCQEIFCFLYIVTFPPLFLWHVMLGNFVSIERHEMKGYFDVAFFTTFDVPTLSSRF